MKKITINSLSVLALLMTVLLSGCNKEKITSDDYVTSVGTVTQAALADAVSDMYSEWESTASIAEEINVSGLELTQPQYLYAMSRLLLMIRDGDNADIEVLNYKAANYPDRDSYDMDEIYVFNGPANGDYTEDLGNIAERLISAMQENGQVPNQTLFTRDGSSIAFSTNRAMVTMARAISSYNQTGTMPETVSTEYLAPPATLKQFAEQFVSYLEVWENNVAETLSADGSHCSDNGTAWENVHFIPIPYSGGYTDGIDQYDPKYQPYHTITVDGITYDAAQCWGIALKGILDLVTLEGSTTWESERNPTTPAHTPGNGKSFSSCSIPTLEDWFIWGSYPWYEKDDDPSVIKKGTEELQTADLEFLLKLIPWHLTRSSQLARIGNFQTFGEDPTSTLVLSPYSGNISPMREFLIAARFYKYLLDNNIDENVYDAMKDVEIDADLYGTEPAALSVSTRTLTFTYEGGTETVTVRSLEEAWTATASDSWVTVTPSSGSAGSDGVQVEITVSANEGSSRSATVIVATASDPEGITISISQNSVPATASIEDFARQYVTIINIWETTTGTCNYMTGIGATSVDEYIEYDVENAHYIPEDSEITVNGVTYNTADMLELALRSYLLLRGYDGNSTTGGNGTFEEIDAFTMEDALPETHSYTWGTNPYNETGSTTAGGVVVGNGGELRMGDASTADGVELVKTDILDNFAQRSANYPITRSNVISNMCGYSSGQLSGYYGTFSSIRALITFAYFFQYMLENDLDNAAGISSDQTFKTVLFRDSE